ncbi:FAD-dependent oxidoreductase [Aliidongia dinghuensis]|uniref:FAD-dependent oxidoreductase n=1 Tax=Aliidongia dinghuensis TaxID=1867774 RepID=A0A8J2YQD0_9PROT|nr:FAD-dependent oxidoreductase [Aliidongia dinghuensis]GGF04524.1 FAD-dependent oxidoreductase [Aliidongia dinghuensis]
MRPVKAAGAFDALVIGGGLVGAAIAWGLARAGAETALIDEGDVAFRAARGNFGLVWVQSKGDNRPEYAHWTRRSAELWPDLAETLARETGIDVALAQPGGLHFCLSEAEMAERGQMITRMHNQSGGIGAKLLDRSELKDMVPGLGPDVRGASFSPVDGHASPLHLLRAFHAGLIGRGGRYLPGRTVDRIAPAPGSFAVYSGTERFVAPKLVVAAGLGSRHLAPMTGLDMPVDPLRGQIMVTERLKRFLDLPTVFVRQTAEGSVLVGDSHEDVGFDNGTTPAVMQDIARRSVATFPALADAQIVRVWGALRVMTPDGFPIYEQSARYPGAFAATCHSGVTLAGAHALALAPAIAAGALPSSLDSFMSGRFHVSAA